MKSALYVLALAVLSSVGCQAIGPKCGQTCTDSSCSEPCHMGVARNAPRPLGLAEGLLGRGSRSGNLETSCPGGDCCAFNRYRGSDGGPGYPNAPYDCSPCSSPDWGCNGYRHPNGYVDGRGFLCNNGRGPSITCPNCGRNFCGTGPAPGCSCPFCGCGPSGDHNYNFSPGPPVAQTAYPYYTLRGPRDFLLNNPPTIGPQ